MSRSITSDLPAEEVALSWLRWQLKIEGGDPSGMLGALAEAVELRLWERLGLSFHEFIESKQGLGWNEDSLRKVILFKHRDESKPDVAERLKRMREVVRDELEIPLPENGEVGRGRNSFDIIKAKHDNSGGTSASYLTRRLKRDRPDLAEKVIKGELSANAAAIQAGFREKTITVKLEPEAAARTLLKHFDADELKVLKRAIDEAISSGAERGMVKL